MDPNVIKIYVEILKHGGRTDGVRFIMDGGKTIHYVINGWSVFLKNYDAVKSIKSIVKGRLAW
jgi:hypothetical protein